MRQRGRRNKRLRTISWAFLVIANNIWNNPSLTSRNLLLDPGCESTKVLALEEPLVYLTVSARASVSLLGSVEALHVVMNWQRPKKKEEDASEGDWIGLFDSAVGAGDTLNGE